MTNASQPRFSSRKLLMLHPVAVLTLSACVPTPSDLLSDLAAMDTAEVAAHQVIAGDWDWLCYATETSKISEIITPTELLWLSDKFSISDSDFVVDNASVVVLAQKYSREYEVHQVNSESIYLTFNVDISVTDTCFRFDTATFIDASSHYMPNGDRKTFNITGESQ